MDPSITNEIVIPAKAGLCRQDAETNTAGAPKGWPQERPVIQRLVFAPSRISELRHEARTHTPRHDIVCDTRSRRGQAIGRRWLPRRVLRARHRDAGEGIREHRADPALVER